MASRKTWLWIILACLGVIVLGLFAIAGAGVYFVSSHIDTEPATISDATRAFDEVRASFKNQQPLFELDAEDEPRAARPLRDIPGSDVRTTELAILVWDHEDERLVRMSLPFWLLRLGGHPIQISDGHGVRFEDLSLDVDQLERVGPVLVFDYRAPDGGRVLLWTQ